MRERRRERRREGGRDKLRERGREKWMNGRKRKEGWMGRWHLCSIG